MPIPIWYMYKSFPPAIPEIDWNTSINDNPEQIRKYILTENSFFIF